MVILVKLRKRSSGLGYYSYEITLPKEIVESLSWKPGDRLIITTEDNKIIVKKAEIK